MKKYIILTLLGLAIVQMYSKHNTSTIGDYSPPVANTNAIPNVDLELANSSGKYYSDEQFTCDGRQYCSQMTSRKEAVYFIQHCPNSKMDGDNDGIPCEHDSRF
ncbi:excalibur calcium-binding domain-containing protein [Vibrio splendidus]|uniref:excalibur calcium-binding domain-containing protein n=1 Tax=Vibrio splendidus TaxID=29497 RepID=UPI003D0F4F98